jgi:tRNA pseudouridine55 synthase
MTAMQADRSSIIRHSSSARQKRALHGVLLLDKPVGLSSNDALQKAKRLFNAEKAGHTGTLDPLASGLLPLCFGAATKFSQVSLDADKRYIATLALGVTTTTGDLEGDVVQQREVQFSAEQLQAACARFTGPIEQTPPMHSALKHEGRALYEYAREGITIDRAARRVVIHGINILSFEGTTVVLDVRCSKGTYIRTLAEVIGEALGCGAHLSALRRTASGELLVEQALTLDALATLTEPERDAHLLPPDVLLSDWPEVRLPADEAARFLTGLRRRHKAPDCAQVRVYGPEPRALLGAAHITAGELIPDRLLSSIEIEGLLANSSPPSRPSPVKGEGEKGALRA